MASKPLDNQVRSAAEVVGRFGGRYSAELGIDLSVADSREVFKWFLAAVLFAARISGNLAARTYRTFAQEDLLTPQKIQERGWDGLVAVLDAGGYVRYDFKTATKLLNVCSSLVERYDGDFDRLHGIATSPCDLEERIKSLGKGIGAVTVGIFLRELRGVWVKAQPALGEPALEAAKTLGFLPADSSDRRLALQNLLRIWSEEGHATKDFPNFESALVRAGLAFRRERRFHRRLSNLSINF
jgi:hypothetical protein